MPAADGDAGPGAPLEPVASGASGGSGNQSQSWQNSGMLVALEADSSSDAAESDTSSIATSMTASATNYRFEHGRRYHAYAESQYALPNDEQEMNRLELQHMIWTKTFNGRLYLSPLPADMTDALDIGAGTGAWAIEFALAHPGTNIIGTDLSPIQPEYVPVNCSWLVDDANQPWPSDFTDKFDFIHTRSLGMGVADWGRLVAQAYRALKPGGWIELQEFCLPLGCDDGSAAGLPMEEWGFKMRASAAMLGIDVSASAGNPERLRAAGFRHVRDLRLKSPIGPWAKGAIAKEVGVMGLRDMHEILEGVSTKLFAMLGMCDAEITEFCEAARRDAFNPRVHMYMPLLVAWGQKPKDAKPETSSKGDKEKQTEPGLTSEKEATTWT